jgi:hypothetical protein
MGSKVLLSVGGDFVCSSTAADLSGVKFGSVGVEEVGADR